MAKTKLNAFLDKNAKTITEDDVKGLLKMQNNAQQIATNEQNKATNKAPNYTTLPSLDDTSKKGNTTPSVSSNNKSVAKTKNETRPTTMKVGNKTFSVSENANNTTLKKDDGKATTITDDNAKKVLSKEDNKKRATRLATSNAERQGVNKPILSTVESVALAPFSGVEGATRTGMALATGDKSYIDDGRSNGFVAPQNNLREGVKANIGSNIGKGAYDIGTSIADMIADTVASGGTSAIAGALMGGQKSIEATKNAYDRNNDVRRSALYGGLAGAAEGYFNTKGLDALKGAGQGLKGIAQAAGVEGAENVLQGITENIADTIVNGKDSEIALQYNNLVNSGVSSEEALQQLAIDRLKGYGMDFATGAGFGTALKAGGNVGGKAVKGAIEGLDTLSRNVNNKIMPNVDFSNIPSLEQKAEMPNRTPDLYASNMYSLINNLNDDVNVGKVNSDIDRVNADRIRQSNPELLGKLSDEDVLKWDAMTNRDANIDNQNYNTLVNVMNNTDNSVNGIKSNGVEDTTGLDFMSNDSPVYDFRQNNSELSDRMTNDDIYNYVRSIEEYKAIELGDIENKLKNAQQVSNELNKSKDYFIRILNDDAFATNEARAEIEYNTRIGINDLSVEEQVANSRRMAQNYLNEIENNLNKINKYTYDLNQRYNQVNSGSQLPKTPEVRKVQNNLIQEDDFDILPQSRQRALDKAKQYEVGQSDIQNTKPTLTQAEYDSRIADFNQRNTVKGIVGEYLNKNTFKGVKFDGEGSTKANASIKNFTQILERLDDINDINELNDYVANELSPAFKEMKEAISQGYVIDNTSVKENEKLRKQLREALKGRKILITPDVEAEFPNMTIREMNNKVGVNAFTKKSDIGSPIDMGRFAEISDETGNALGIADGPNAELIQRIFDYADSLKNAEPTRVNVDANAATRELLGEAQEVIDAKRTLLNELGSRPEGLIDETDIRPEAYTNRLDELPKANVNFGDIDEVETSGKPLLTSEEVEAILRGMGNDTESVPSFDTSRIETVNNVTRPLATLEPKQNTTVKKVDTSPSMVNSVPVIDSPTLKERGYSESIREKTDLPDEIKKEFATNPEMYEVLHNSQTQARADYILDNNDIDGALNETLKLLSTKDPTALPLGYNVSKMLIDNGRRDDAEALLRMMSESLTESGQFSQAAAITMMHNDPMTALRYMQKEIDRLNVEGQKKYKKNWKDFSLTDDEIDMFNNLEQGDAEGIKNAYDQVGKRLSKEYPSSNWEKFVELTKLSMLLNPRTHIRNFSANGLLLPMRSASDRISALGQNAAKLLGSDAEVTQSLVGGTKEQKRIAGEIFDNDFKDLLSGDDKWDSLQGVARQKQVFNNSKAGWYATEGAYRGVGLVNKLTGGKLDGVLSQMDESMTDSTLENLRRFDYYLLSTVEDDPFVKANFVNRLASYMKAQNINSIDDVPAEAKSLAWQESLKATFKDDNNLTRMLGNMKKELGKFGEVLFPFTKTPANLAARAADYSPIGIAKALADYYKMPVNQRNIGKMWDDMSKGITGTSGILLGYALAKSGVITGALSDDADEQQFQKQQGMQQYSLHLGDKYYSYDWAQPAGTPLIMGATIYDALKNSDEEESNALKKLANGTWEGSKAAFDAWFDLSPLQTVQELLSGDEYGSTSGGIADRVVDTITGMPQRLIPSLMGATARTVDPTMRETYDKNSAVKTWVNEAKAKVPAIGDDDNWWNTNVSSKSLPAKYDTWGNERKRSDTVGQAAFAQYVNPGQLSNSNITPIDNAIVELGNNIADEKTKQKIYPRKASWTVNGQTLTNEEHSDYQKELGQTSYKLAEKLINSEGFNSLSYEDKAEALNDMYNLADKITQQKLFGKEISNKNDIENANLYEKDIDKLISNYNNKNTLNTYAGDYKDKEGNNLSYNGLSKDKKVEVLEKAYNNGEITSEQLADYIPDDKVAKALSNYDNGTQIYLDLVKNAYTDNRFDLDKALPVLMKTNASYDEVGSVIYAMQSTKSTTKLNQVHSEKGNEGVLDYTMYKKYADADGNGSLKNTEITNYLNSINLTNDERRYWYSVLAKNNNKNPY